MGTLPMGEMENLDVSKTKVQVDFWLDYVGKQ